MKIIRTISKTVSNGQVLNLSFNNNGDGDTVVGETYFQTHSSVPFTVAGTVDGTHYQNMKVVNMATFDISDSVSAAGYYMVPCTGLKSAKLTFTGAGDIFIKEVF